MRKRIVAGNWKMNMLQNEAVKLVSDIRAELQNRKQPLPENSGIIIMPPFPWIPFAVEQTRDDEIISTGAQNCYHQQKGAYTGEVSPDMIASAGAGYVILGHSERREYFEETGGFLRKKVDAVLQTGLKPVFCCGEPLEVRESNRQNELVKQQLKESVFHLSKEDFSRLIIAYEPVWAIGTGKTASPQQAQEMHKFIRDQIAERYNGQLAADITILYGGSCKPSNAKELFAQEDVDGGLIGGASLKAKDFIDIFFSF